MTKATATTIAERIQADTELLLVEIDAINEVEPGPQPPIPPEPPTPTDVVKFGGQAHWRNHADPENDLGHLHVDLIANNPNEPQSGVVEIIAHLTVFDPTGKRPHVSGLFLQAHGTADTGKSKEQIFKIPHRSKDYKTHGRVWRSEPFVFTLDTNELFDHDGFKFMRVRCRVQDNDSGGPSQGSSMLVWVNFPMEVRNGKPGGDVNHPKWKDNVCRVSSYAWYHDRKTNKNDKENIRGYVRTEAHTTPWCTNFGADSFNFNVKPIVSGPDSAIPSKWFVSLDPALHKVPPDLGDIQAEFTNEDGLGVQTVSVDTTNLANGTHKLMTFSEGRRKSDWQEDGSFDPHPGAQLAGLLMLGLEVDR